MKAISNKKTIKESKNENFICGVLKLFVRKAIKQLIRSGRNDSMIKRMGIRYLKDDRRD